MGHLDIIKECLQSKNDSLRIKSIAKHTGLKRKTVKYVIATNPDIFMNAHPLTCGSGKFKLPKHRYYSNLWFVSNKSA